MSMQAPPDASTAVVPAVPAPTANTPAPRPAPRRVRLDDGVLRERIARHLVERDALMADVLRHSGVAEPEAFIRRAFAQSQLFMAELIPLIHRLYGHEPVNVTKTVLDVGPQNFAGTQLLASIHDPGSYVNLKMKISAIDIVDVFQMLQKLVAPGVEFIHSDIYDVQNRTWDLVIASHVIEHVPDPAQFVRRLQQLARDYVIIACPWNENPLVTRTHVNTIDKSFVRTIGARDLQIYTNYSWGKSREACIFWLPGTARTNG